MKLILGRVGSILVVALLWLYIGIRTVLDLIGYATVPEDMQVASGLLRDFLIWVLSVPWWAPWGLAVASTLLLIWVSWPRSQPHTEAPAESTIALSQTTEFNQPPMAVEEIVPIDPLDAISGPDHERLELFILDFILPACSAQIVLQERILKKMGDNPFLLRFANLGLRNDYTHQVFNRTYDVLSNLGSSPMPEMTNGEMVESIIRLENENYRKFCDQSYVLGKSLSIKIQTEPDLTNLWGIWCHQHNRLVKEYDILKRESRFGRPLYRPQKPSRWGDAVDPDPH